MRRWMVGVMSGTVIVLLVGCATAPPAYRLTPDGAKEFVVEMRGGNFSPSYLVVNQGDRVRLVLYSAYQFAFFYFNEFRINRFVAHDAPEVVEFVATPQGWFDFDCYGFYPYYAHLILAGSDGGKGGDQHHLYGRLYIQ